MPSQGARATFKPPGHDHAVCVEDALAAAEELCAARGARLTRLRRRVLELVLQQHNPVGAYDLLDRLRAEGRAAAPPTVYRALDFLLQTGLVHKIESLNAFVGCARPHAPHSGQFLICRDCKAVGELEDAAIAGLIARHARDLGFEVLSQTVEVIGLCPACGGGGEVSVGR